MTDKLTQLTSEIEAAKKRLARLNDEIRENKERLDEARKAQTDAIVNDKDAGKIGKDILALEKELEGRQGAHKQLTETIRGLGEQRMAEMRAIGKAQAEITKGECHGLEAKIYSLLVDAAAYIPELEKKRAEYFAALRQAEAKDAGDENHKIVILRDALQKGIPDLLGCFPRSLIADGKLPDPDSVRRSMRK